MTTLLAFAFAFVNLNEMRYKADDTYLNRLAAESGLPIEIITANLLVQLISAFLFMYSYYWPTAMTIAALLELPNSIIGAYVVGTRKAPTKDDINAFNLYFLMTMGCLSIFLLPLII